MRDTAFRFFENNSIKTRDDLRNYIGVKPFNDVLMEGFWVEYKSKDKRLPKDIIKVVQFNDTHVPYQDDKTLNAIFKFIKDFQPDKIVIAGDFLDFYELSRFDKNPHRKFKLKDELKKGYEILAEIKDNCKQTEINFIKGNHEDRLRRYLWQNPELASLDVLELPNLLHFDKLEAIYHEGGFIFNKFLFEHGNVVRQDSSFSAKAEHQRHGTSGSSGHTHRLGSYYKTDHRGTTAWFEMGCTCLLEPEYISGIPNWQQGIGVFHFEDDRYSCQQIPIIHNKFIFDGKVYS